MPLPYLPMPLPSYAMPLQMAQPPPPPQMQILPNRQSLGNAQPASSQSKKSKRTLKNEVEALQEMIKTLSVFSPDVNAYAGQLIRQSEVLSQLEWTASRTPAQMTPQALLRQLPQRIDGGSEMARRQLHQHQQRMEGRQRHDSDVSSGSSNSTAAQQPQQSGQGRKRNRRKRDSSDKSTATQSQKTELEAMRTYINKIVHHHVGTDHQLPPEMLFSGNFSDLEAHAQRLAAAGYGRIVEEEIRVNRKNNRQAFITMSTDREGLERDGIVLLPVARRYAFEGDKVRAFVLNASSSKSAEPESMPSSGGITGGKPSISLGRSFCVRFEIQELRTILPFSSGR